jgi:hypothetical protein
MGAVKAKLQNFKAPKSSPGRRGSVKMPKEPKAAKSSGGGGGSKMSPTSMFYLGRTMKRDQDSAEMGAANSRIAIQQQGAGLNNAADVGELLKGLNSQFDAALSMFGQ